ncbi:hypothetical protein D3C81_2098990 [compost metagenome]
MIGASRTSNIPRPNSTFSNITGGEANSDLALSSQGVVVVASSSPLAEDWLTLTVGRPRANCKVCKPAMRWVRHVSTTRQARVKNHFAIRCRFIITPSMPYLRLS